MCCMSSAGQEGGCGRVLKIPTKCYTGRGLLEEQVSSVDETGLVYKADSKRAYVMHANGIFVDMNVATRGSRDPSAVFP